MKWLPILGLLAGCDPTVYADLEDEAGTRVLEAPDDYPRRGYGKVVVAFDGELGGARVSRIGTTGGEGTPFAVYDVWNDDGFELDASLYTGCKREGQCDDGAGTSIVPIPVWRKGDAFEGHLCILVASPPSGSYFVRCEDQEDRNTFMGMSGIGLGSAGATLGVDNPVGVALLGAPSANGRGAIYRVPDGAALVEVPVRVEAVGAGADLGAALAAARMDDGSTLIVAGAPGERKVLVLVATANAGNVEVELRACMTGEPGFGAIVAATDLDSDGAPEVLVGHQRDAEGRGLDVVMFAGSDLPSAASDTCAGWGSAPERIACPDGTRDISCEDAGFGASIASGDLDADGNPELLIGAPGAEVDGANEAGAVFVFRGGAGGIAIASPDALTLSKPEDGDELGASLAVVRTMLGAGQTPRDEVVAGAPGGDLVAVFLCSGLDGDSPDIGDRCMPE